MKVFPLSLSRDICEDDEKGHDPLEFITWANSKFKDHKKVDETTKRALLNTWIEVGNEERLMNDVVSSDEEWEEHEYGDPPNIVADSSKPYLDTHHKRDGSNNAKWNENTSELGKAPHPNKVSDSGRTCKTEKFEVIKYSLGPNEEYIAI
ncbi:hypothetical protein Tco_1370359 [Tanacetum coccineum]